MRIAAVCLMLVAAMGVGCGDDDGAFSARGRLTLLSTIEYGRGIYAVSTADKPVTLIANVDKHTFHGAISPDNSTFAYVDEGAIYLADSNGDNPRVVAGKASASKPSWSPDGRELAFVSNRREPAGNRDDNIGVSQVFVLNFDASVVRRVTDLKRAVRSPRWSPDGSRIIFEYDRGLLATGPDGAEVDEFAPAEGNHPRYLNPLWSPNGQWVVATYVASRPLPNRPEKAEIRLIAARDGTVQRLTQPSYSSPNSVYDAPVAWSADGNHILFMSQRRERQGLHWHNIHTNEVTVAIVIDGRGEPL